jgi:molybdopterin synthase catalytic subunit
MQLPSAAPASPAPVILTIQCRLFARYAELFGRPDLVVRVPEPATVADVVQALREHRPGGEAIPARPLVAVNLEHALMHRPVRQGDEVALLPPLAGG